MRLAEHFNSVGDSALAEKYFVDAGNPQEAVKMYIILQRWEKSYKLSLTYMTKENASNWFSGMAKEMESQGKLLINIREIKRCRKYICHVE
jgi:intraflagellar transport protein 172